MIREDLFRKTWSARKNVHGSESAANVVRYTTRTNFSPRTLIKTHHVTLRKNTTHPFRGRLFVAYPSWLRAFWLNLRLWECVKQQNLPVLAHLEKTPILPLAVDWKCHLIAQCPGNNKSWLNFRKRGSICKRIKHGKRFGQQTSL